MICETQSSLNLHTYHMICETRSSLNLHTYHMICESDYGALQNTEVLCALRSIFNFKSKMIDPNRSI
jgi:hypothetical protein